VQIFPVNHESFNVSFIHLSESKSVLAYLLANAPIQLLRLFDDVALSVTLTIFPDYWRIRDVIHVRVTDLPILQTPRSLRKLHLGCLVRVRGVVSAISSVYPQLFLVKFNCARCGDVFGPFTTSSSAEVKANVCPTCQSRGPFNINMEKVCQ